MSGHLTWEELGGRPPNEAERAHLAECAECRAEVARRDALAADLRRAVPPALSEQIRAAARAELARTPRPRSWERSWLLAAMVSLAAALPGLIMPLRADWASVPSPARALNLALPALAFLIASAAAFWPGLRLRLGAASAVAGLAALVLLTLPGEHPGEPRGGLHCAVAVLLVSTLPLLSLLAVLRREELGRGRGALAALGAGALGVGMLFRACPISRPGHLLIHLLGWALVVGLGVWGGAMLRTPVWRPPERRT